MIILNGDKGGQKHDSYNGNTVRLPERVARRRRSWSPLPDYEASEAQYRRSLALDTGKPWHKTKGWRMAILGLLAYALLTTAVGVPIIVTKLRDRSRQQWDPSTLGNQLFSPPGLIALGESMVCNTWNSTNFTTSPRPYTATLHAQLAPAGDIYIRSNATTELMQLTKINGSLTVEYDPETKSKDAVFTATLRTSTLALQNTTLVCYAATGANRGLSIFLPNSIPDTDSIHLDIRLVLPRTTNSSPTISNLNTYLPMFSQTIRDLKKVSFGAVTIEGSFRPIDITNLRAPRISVKNMLGDISATLNSSEAVNLDTIKGAINASIILVKPSTRSSPTSLTLDTGDSEINARVTLLSSSKVYSLPHFVGKVATFDGPINLNISHHQSTSTVPTYFTVQNNLARSKVMLDQKFEGTFVAQTKLANATIHKGTDNPKFDPTGAQKPRTLLFDQQLPSRSSGWIGWGKRPTVDVGQSHLEAFSSLSPVELVF